VATRACLWNLDTSFSRWILNIELLQLLHITGRVVLYNLLYGWWRRAHSEEKGKMKRR
jgi:hypothetical protein